MLQVRQGYVHVWGDASPSAFIDSAAKPPMLVPELDPDAESAVLRDGSKPLSAGKRYLRGMLLASTACHVISVCRALSISLSACAKLILTGCTL